MPADVATQLGHDLQALAGDLRGGRLGDAQRLGPGLDARLLDDLRPLALRLGADAPGLLARLGELLLVLRQQLLASSRSFSAWASLPSMPAVRSSRPAPWAART
jgi:hypothetical protein